MDNIYTDSKGKKLTRKSAFYTATELNQTAKSGLWTWEIDKDFNFYLWFQEFAPAKVGA